MKIKTKIDIGGHIWKKQNNVPKIDKNGNKYDIYTCSCGLKAKRKGESNTIFVYTSEQKLIDNCTKLYKQIRITNFYHKAPEFKNCIRGTIHNIIPWPKYYSKEFCSFGVCIMGDGVPVKLFPTEFEYVTPKINKNEKKNV